MTQAGAVGDTGGVDGAGLVEVILQAKDLASATIEKTQQTVASFSATLVQSSKTSVGAFNAATAAMVGNLTRVVVSLGAATKAVLSFGQAAIPKLQQFYDLLTKIQTGDTEGISAAGSIFQEIYEDAIEYTGRVQKLSDTLNAVGKTAGFLSGNFGAGLTGFDRVIDGIRNKARNALEFQVNEKRVSATFGRAIAGGIDFGIGKLPPSLQGVLAVPLVQNAISGVVENAVLKNFLARKLPGGLNKFLGKPLTKILSDVGRNPALRNLPLIGDNLLPTKLRAVTGNIFENLPVELGRKLGSAYVNSLKGLEKGIDNFFGRFAVNAIRSNTARAILSAFDSLTGGGSKAQVSLAEFIGKPLRSEIQRSSKLAFQGLTPLLLASVGPSGLFGKKLARLLLGNFTSTLLAEAGDALLGSGISKISQRFLNSAVASAGLGDVKVDRSQVQAISDTFATLRPLISKELNALAGSTGLKGFDLANALVNAAPEEIAARLRQTIGEGLKQAGLTGQAKLGQALNLGEALLRDIAGNDAIAKAKDFGRKIYEALTSFSSRPASSGQADTIAAQLNRSFEAVVARLPNFLVEIVRFSQNAGKALLAGIERALSLGALTGNFIRIFGQLDAALGGLLSATGKRLGLRIVTAIATGATGAAQNAGSRVGEFLFRGLLNTADRVDAFVINVGRKLNRIPDQFRDAFSIASKPAFALSGFQDAIAVAQTARKNFVGAFNAISQVGFQISSLSQGFSVLQQLVASGPFKALVGQNIELRKQLLETQSSLVATNQILRDGQQIVDPGAAIVALESPLRAAINRLKKDSLDLVGVTSGQLNELFNIVTGSISQLGVTEQVVKRVEGVNNPLDAAVKLSIQFAASLGTIGLPLNQARQEILSIVNAQIDSNSVLAKTLGINSEMVRQQKAQGTLYEFLLEKMDAFSVGNQIAARSFEGITSNIQEIFEVAALKAGEPLLDPILEDLARFYRALTQNQQGVVQYLQGAVKSIDSIRRSVTSVLESIATNAGDALLAVPDYIFREIAATVELFANSLNLALEVFRPVLGIFAQLTQVTEVANRKLPILGISVGQVAIHLFTFSKAIGVAKQGLTLLAKLAPGLGEALFLVSLRSGELTNRLTFLVKQGFNPAAAAALIMGKNLHAIPGALRFVSRQIPVFGGAIARVIPQISGLIIAMAGMAGTSRVVNSVFREVGGTIGSDLLPSLGKLAKQKGLTTLGTTLQLAGRKAKNASKNIDILSLANEKLSGVLKEAGRSARQQAIQMGVWGAAIAAAVILISEFLQRQRDFGDEIRAISADVAAGAALIRETWSQTQDATADPLVSNTDPPPLDWIDKVILKARELEKGELQIYSFGDALFAFAAIVGEAGNAIVRIVQFNARTIGTILGGLMEFVGAILKNPFDLSNIKQAFTNLITFIGESSKESFGELFQFLGDVETKAEEKVREIESAIASGGLADELQNLTNEFAEFENALASGERTTGELFKPEVDTAKLALAQGDVEGFKAAIASLPEAFPESTKQNLLDFFDSEFPNGVIDSQEAVEKLDKTLNLANAEASNIRLKQMSESLEANRSALEDQLQSLDKSGRGQSKAAVEIRKYIQQIEALEEKLNGLNQNIDIQQDPTKALETEVQGANQALEKLSNQRATREKEGIADLTEAYANGELSKSEFEESRADFSKRLKETELAETEKHLNKLLDSYNNLSDEQKANAGKLEQEIGKIRQKAADLRSQVAQAELDRQKAQIQRFNEEAQELADQRSLEEQEGIAELTEAYGRGELNKFEFEEARADLSQGVREQELAATREHLEKLLAAYNALSEEQKENATDLQKEITKVRSQEARLRSQIAQAEIDKERRLRAKAYKDIESAQDKALDAIKAAENERTLELKKLYSEGAILKEELDEQTAKSTQERIQGEIAAEKERIAALEALPKTNDPDAEKERLGKIRDARLKLQQLTIQGVDAEIRAQEAAIALIRRKIQEQTLLLKNQIEEQNQGLQRQDALYESLGKQLELQNRLFESRRNLQQAAANFLQSELSVLIQSERSEFRKKKLQEAAAALKLKALRESQAFELRSLEIQEQQNALALEREKIQNRINKSQQIAAIAESAGKLEELKADPRATEGQKRAAELQLAAQLSALENFNQLDQFFVARERVAKEEAKNQRRQLELSQKAELRQAQGEFVGSLASPGRQARAQRALQRTIAKEDFGADSFRDLRNQLQATSNQELAGLFGPGFGRTSLESAFDPNLGSTLELAGLSARDRAAILGETRGRFAQQFGPGGGGVTSRLPAGTKPLELPKEFFGSDLPDLNLGGLGIQIQGAGETFSSSADRLADKLDQLFGKGFFEPKANNVTLNVSGGRSNALSAKGQASLENVVGELNQIFGGG